LETIELTTGFVTPLATVGYGGTVNDIAADPLSGALYGLAGANLFTINTATGATTTVSAGGMSGSMESLAFDSAGNLYIASQSGLYGFNRSTGVASYIGDYGSAVELNGTGQNIRFAGSSLYVTNTDVDPHDTDLYSINTSTGSASFVGTIDGHASVALGNSGSHLYGSCVPAVGGGSGSLDLLDFGTTVATYVGPTEEGSETLVAHDQLLTNTFPGNVNFTAIPEHGRLGTLACLVGSGVFLRFRRRSFKA